MTTITLPNSLTTACVAFDGTRYFATDGIYPHIYIFDTSGLFLTRINTLHAYTKIHYYQQGDSFTCLTACGSGIYICNNRLEEVARIPLAYAGEHAVDAYCRNGLYEVTYPSKVILCDNSGMMLDSLFTAPRGMTFDSWLTIGCGYEMCYTQNNRQSVRINGETKELPNCVKFKGFLPYCNQTNYAVTSQYLYTYILEANTALSLNINNILSGCCNS